MQDVLPLPKQTIGLIGEYVLDGLEYNNVSDGYGEFIVFDKTGRFVNRDRYDFVYGILNRFSVRNLDKPLEDRPKAIREKIHRMDSQLDICFIPNTLHALFLMHLMMDEEKRSAEQDHTVRCVRIKERDDSMLTKVMYGLFAKPMCWHGIECLDGEESSNNDERIRNIAYALNQVLIKKIQPTGKGLTRKAIVELAAKEIDYLRENHEAFLAERYQPIPGTVSSIFSPHKYGDIYDLPMHHSHVALLFTAIDIECSQQAKNAVILYRGGDFERDATSYIDLNSSKKTPCSVSFGTGVFAGIIYDPDASAAINWFKEKRDTYRDAYLLILPVGGSWKKYFYIPKNNALGQMFGLTDTFHSRTYIPRIHFKEQKPFLGQGPGPVKGLFYQREHTKQYAEKHFPIDVSDEELAKAFHTCKIKYGMVLKRAEMIPKKVQKSTD